MIRIPVKPVVQQQVHRNETPPRQRSRDRLAPEGPAASAPHIHHNAGFPSAGLMNSSGRPSSRASIDRPSLPTTSTMDTPPPGRAPAPGPGPGPPDTLGGTADLHPAISASGGSSGIQASRGPGPEAPRSPSPNPTRTASRRCRRRVEAPGPPGAPGSRRQRSARHETPGSAFSLERTLNRFPAHLLPPRSGLPSCMMKFGC